MLIRTMLLRLLLVAALVLLALQQTVVRGKAVRQSGTAAPGIVFADGGSGRSAISVDGRFVAFMSFASNLVPGDINRSPDIFVRDWVSGTTELVSVGNAYLVFLPFID